MLTVREACALINNPTEVGVAVNGNSYPLFREGSTGYDSVMVEAFGDYVVKDIFSCVAGCFELEVKMCPMKKEDIACTN